MASPPLPDAVWRASRIGSAAIHALPSGFPALDAELPGAGWPAGMLTELISRESGIGELRLLVPLLRRLTRERRFAVLLGPPQIPYAPGLAAHGIDPDYLLIVQAAHAADRLWAVEQTLKSSGFGALLAWLPQPRTRPEHLRRMQLAAHAAHGPVFLFRPLEAQFEASPAPLRLLLLPCAAERLSVQILKRRGPLIADPILVDLPRPPSSIRPRSQRDIPCGGWACFSNDCRSTPSNAEWPHPPRHSHCATGIACSTPTMPRAIEASSPE